MSFDNPRNGYRDPDTFDIRATILDITNATRYYKGVVILTVFLTLALVTAYVYLWPPIYRAEAKLMTESDADTVRDDFYLGWNVFRKDDPITEMELIRSAPVLKEVIERERLTYDDVYHTFLSQLAYLWQQSYVGKKYREVKRWFIPEEEAVVSPEEAELGRTIVDMSKGITVDPVGEANVGILTVKGPSPKVAVITNTLIEVYMRTRGERHVQEARSSYDALTGQVVEAERAARASSERRLDFVREHDVTFDFSKETLEVGKLAELELEIAGTHAKAATLEASLRRIEDRLAMEPVTQTNQTVYEINALRETTKMKRLELQTGLIQARNVYRDDSPEIQEILHNLRELDDMIAAGSERVEKSTSEALNGVRQDMLSTRNQLELELAGTRAGLAVMEETAGKLRSRLSNLTAWMTELQNLDREFQLDDQMYKMLVQKRAQAAVASATAMATTPSLRVIEFAAPPPDRWWPILKLLYPAALLVGLILGVGVALILSYASGRIRREHVERGHGTAPLYSILEVPEEVPSLAVLPRGNGVNASSSFESKN